MNFNNSLSPRTNRMNRKTQRANAGSVDLKSRMEASQITQYFNESKITKETIRDSFMNLQVGNDQTSHEESLIKHEKHNFNMKYGRVLNQSIDDSLMKRANSIERYS